VRGQLSATIAAGRSATNATDTVAMRTSQLCLQEQFEFAFAGVAAACKDQQ
jgi:hypothetical protein